MPEGVGSVTCASDDKVGFRYAQLLQELYYLFAQRRECLSARFRKFSARSLNSLLGIFKIAACIGQRFVQVGGNIVFLTQAFLQHE